MLLNRLKVLLIVYDFLESGRDRESREERGRDRNRDHYKDRDFDDSLLFFFLLLVLFFSKDFKRW